jgi:hypothetical protein
MAGGTDGGRFAAVEREPLRACPPATRLRCTTLCPVLDAWLHGGVPTAHLTELAGGALALNPGPEPWALNP